MIISQSALPWYPLRETYVVKSTQRPLSETRWRGGCAPDQLSRAAATISNGRDGWGDWGWQGLRGGGQGELSGGFAGAGGGPGQGLGRSPTGANEFAATTTRSPPAWPGPWRDKCLARGHRSVVVPRSPALPSSLRLRRPCRMKRRSPTLRETVVPLRAPSTLTSRENVATPEVERGHPAGAAAQILERTRPVAPRRGRSLGMTIPGQVWQHPLSPSRLRRPCRMNA